MLKSRLPHLPGMRSVCACAVSPPPPPPEEGALSSSLHGSMYVLVLALTLGNLPILSVHVPSGANINELPHVQRLELCLAHGKHPVRIGCSDYIDLGSEPNLFI